jgi:hypothetical protein
MEEVHPAVCGSCEAREPGSDEWWTAKGLAWMDAFIKSCTGCTIDAIAIHIYDSATNVAYFKNYISSGKHIVTCLSSTREYGTGVLH